ncbi:sulfotransferase family cytosolic 2B member 1-like [Pelobates cultripes]|nr:sulfotransferase family cytosolic 2B member 1-like [Pelobates cultripes]
MIEILSLLKQGGDPGWCNNVPIWLRSPWYETKEGQSQIKDVISPRVLTSHLPIQIFAKSFFNSKAKIIYIMRNPKDILVSLYHFSKILSLYKDPVSFDTFFDDFLQGNVLYGSWFDHVKGWMQMKKNNTNIFYITYEELQQDIRGSVMTICKFLQKEFDDTLIDSIVKHSTFQAMKNNKMSNYSVIPQDFMDQTKGSFMRKGVSGDWKNHFTVAQSEEFDKVYQEKMKDLKMTFFGERT